MIALRDSLGSDFIEEVRSLFSESGLLAKAKNFEYRPRAAGDGGGRGARPGGGAPSRGRSRHRRRQIDRLPGSRHPLTRSSRRRRRSSRRTRSILQEQLLDKDIPILKKILPIEFEAALMKGRQNYLCPRRLERALQQASELFTTSETAELERIADWARTTKDGSLSDLAVEPDPKVWTQVCSEAHICTDQNVRPDARIVSFSRRANACSRRT